MSDLLTIVPPVNGPEPRHHVDTHRAIAGQLSVDTILLANPHVETDSTRWVLGEADRAKAYFLRQAAKVRDFMGEDADTVRISRVSA